MADFLTGYKGFDIHNVEIIGKKILWEKATKIVSYKLPAMCIISISVLQSRLVYSRENETYYDEYF